jgi:hypothetical protein
MTMGLSDTRYGKKPTMLVLSSGFNSDQNRTTYKTVTGLTTGTLPVGTYALECYLKHNGNANYATAGAKDKIVVISGEATAVGLLARGFDNSASSTLVPTGIISSNPFAEASISTRSQATSRIGIITVTSDAVIAVQIAQAAAVAASNMKRCSRRKIFFMV